MDKKDLSTRIARWFLLLEEYNYVVEHRAGSRMRHVDSLSRNPIFLVEVNRSLSNICDAQKADNGLKAFREILKERPYQNYLLKNDMLYKLHDSNEILVIPKNIQTGIILKAHGEGDLNA